MARRVHGERSVGLLYGQRALLIGALEPLTYTGTMLSTNAGDHPFTRLARTAKIQETVFLGTKAEADKALGGGPPPARADQGRAARGGRRPSRRRRLLGLRPGADAVDAGGDRRLRAGDVRNDGAAAERRGARGALAGLRPLRRALPPAARRGPCQLPRVPRLVRRQTRLPRPARDRARAGDGAARRLPPAGAAAGAAQPGDPEPDRQGDAAAARARDLRHPLDTPPTKRAFRSVTAAHRRARHAMPRQLRRGRNDYFFNVVTQREKRRGGTRTPLVHSDAA